MDGIKPRVTDMISKQYAQKRCAFSIAGMVVIALLLAVLQGCVSIQDGTPEKVEDVASKVLEENEIPKKLAEAIDEKKEAEFKMSFENKDGLYLVHGYGEQETGGYSIAVRNLYLTEQTLYFDTELLGPEHGSNPPKKPSCPYIVVQTAKCDKPVVFE